MMSRKVWVRLIASLAALGLLGLAPTVAQADSYDGGFGYPPDSSCVVASEVNPDGVIADAPPPPICFDPAGTAEDEAVAPAYNPRWVYTVGPLDDYVTLFDDQPYLTNGETIVVEVWDNGDGSGSQYGVSTTQFVLSFPNTADVTPAPNNFWVEVGDQCFQDGWANYRKVTGFMEQVADPGKAYTQYVYPTASNPVGLFGEDGDEATRVMDGTTVGMAVMAHAGSQEGLRSGYTWHVKFEAQDVPGGPLYTAYTETVVVPACPGDPVVTPPSSAFKKPTARIFRTGAHTVRVQMNKGSLPKVLYGVVVDPPGQRNAKTSVYWVKTKQKSVWKTKLRFGTRVVVRAKYKGGWHRVDWTLIGRDTQ